MTKTVTSPSRRARKPELRTMSAELEDALAAMLTAAASIVDASGYLEPRMVGAVTLNSIRRVGLMALADVAGKPKRKRTRRSDGAPAVLQLAA